MLKIDFSLRALEINKKSLRTLREKNMQILHSKIYGQEKNGTPLLVFHGLFGMLDNCEVSEKSLENCFQLI